MAGQVTSRHVEYALFLASRYRNPEDALVSSQEIDEPAIA